MSQSLQEELSRLLAEGQAKGIYTHYSFSCGFLKESKNLFLSEGLFGGESFFDLASLTKAFVTSPLVLKSLSEEGFDETVTISEWLKEESSCFARELRGLKVFDLLTHTSGLPAWFNFWVRSSGETKSFEQKPRLVQRLNDCISLILPNQGFVYSDVGFILLGLSLELKYKKNLKILFKDYQKECLGLKGPQLFYPDSSLWTKAVPTSFCQVRNRSLQGEVHDENCAFLGGVTGHAGLFGSIKGTEFFLKALWRSREAKKMLSFLKKGEPKQASCGLRVRAFKKEVAFGHLGFTGCAFWLFPKDSSYLVFLTNRVYRARLSLEFSALREKVLVLGREVLVADRK